MKIFKPVFIFLLLPLLTHGAAELILAQIIKQTFVTNFISGGLTLIFDVAKMIAEPFVKSDSKDNIASTAGPIADPKMNVSVKVEKTTEVVVDIEVESKEELSQVADILKQSDEKIKASFKSVKTLLRDQHFQTHIQFPNAHLMLQLEQFLYHPSNATESDLKITCTKYLPNEILKNMEMMLKDNFLSQQSDNNPAIFAKLERGIVLMVKQLVFAQSICLTIRKFDSEEVHKAFAFLMAKNIEFYIKKHKLEVQAKFHLNAVFGNALKNDYSFSKSDYKNNNASLYEPIGKVICQKAKASANLSSIDFFLTRDTSDFTVVTKNRFFKESFNGWIVYAFYPKFTLRQANRIEATKTAEDFEDGNSKRPKNVIKNQIIFECFNSEHCSLIGGDASGMFSRSDQRYSHFAICGDVGVTIGRPIVETRKSSEEMTLEEKAEIEKWEKTKKELSELLKARKVKEMEAEEKRKDEKEKLIEATVAKVLEEMKAKNSEVEAKLPSLLAMNSAESSAATFTTIALAFYHFVF